MNYFKNSKIKQILEKAETQLVIFFLYIFMFFLLLRSPDIGWVHLAFFHLLFVFTYLAAESLQNFLLLLLSPLMALGIPVMDYFVKKYLENFKQNTPEEVAIILGHHNFLNFKGWTKPILRINDLKKIVEFLKKRNKSFSFYPKPTVNDIEKIMANKDVKEVFFVGHGTSHVFELQDGKILYYCDFKDSKKYKKDYIHQVHCGTPDGDSLVDYVVPEKNKDKCFFVRKEINSFGVEKEFNKLIEKWSIASKN